jgi:hypothetical protein
MHMKKILYFFLLTMVIVQVSLRLSAEKKMTFHTVCPDADFVSISPYSMTAGNTTRITVKFKNSGSCIWKKGTVKLHAIMTSKPFEAQWTDGIKRKFGLVDDFPGYVITSDIAVNGIATFNFVVDAFPSKGTYEIKYQLIRKPGVDDFFGEGKRINFTVK